VTTYPDTVTVPEVEAALVTVKPVGKVNSMTPLVRAVSALKLKVTEVPVTLRLF
jgi:hypothetical protein